jgi:hypothetical protein
MCCAWKGKLKGCCTAMCSSPFVQRTHIAPAELDGQTLLVPGFAPDALAPLCRFLQERLKF